MLVQVGDVQTLAPIVEDVVASSPGKAEAYRGRGDRARRLSCRRGHGSDGRAGHPKRVKDLLVERLGG